MYQTIVVPIDGTRRSEAAIPFAAGLASGCGASLELVRVHRTRPDLGYDALLEESFRQDERNHLACLAAKCELIVGRRVRTTLLDGPVVSTLCEYIGSRAAPLVVMTVHARTGIQRALLGSVSDGLVRHGPAAVLMLRQHRADGRVATWSRLDAVFHRIMVPLDGTALAEAALAPAVALARRTGAKLHLIRVVVPMMARAVVGPVAFHSFPVIEESTVTRDDLAFAYLDGVADRINAGGGLLVTTEVALSDRAGSAITESCRRNGANLVVMAVHGRGGSRVFLGAVADDILRKGPDAILLLRPADVGLPAGLRSRVSIPERVAFGPR
jgi:nucleotide-binding universal stress UspA family protein